MATITYTRSTVRVIGRIWMPAATCAMDYDLSSYDVDNIQRTADYNAGYMPDGINNPTGQHAEITRDDVEEWLGTRAGDFQSVDDFEASINLGSPGQDVDIPWASEDSYFTYCDCMCGSDDE